MKNILTALASALLVASCAFENPATPPLPPEERVAELSFMASMPAAATAMTRGEGSAAENKIDDIHILVFGTSGNDAAKLIYKGKGKNVVVTSDASNDNKVTFKATLPVGGYYDYVMLANAADLLAPITVGGATQFMHGDIEALVRSLAAGAKWDASKPVPMWGVVPTQNLDHNSSVAFALTRMVARVDVKYTPKSGAPTNFDLTSVRVYNYSKNGAIVPAAAAFNNSKPTLPAGGYSSELRQNPIIYSGGEMIYLFEAPHNGKTYSSVSPDDGWIDNPCLVVGGKFSNDGGATWSANETYYRVDFIENSAWLSLLRNHSYNVTITEVSGEGFKDPDTALKSAPFNIAANVLPWNDREMGNIVFDGQFYLSVDRDAFRFGRRGESARLTDRTNVVRIKTDYVTGGDPTHAGSGWHVDRIVDAAGNPVTWLRLNPASRPDGWAPGDVNEAYFSFETNNTAANRSAEVWIRAGRIEYRIDVTQTVLSLDIVDPQHGTPIDEISFVIPDAGYFGNNSRQFAVEWTPSANSMKITGTSPVTYNPFEPTWISGGTAFPMPDNGEQAWEAAQPSNTVARKVYSANPPAVPKTVLDKEPFYEKATEYTFEVENLGEKITRSVMLHQIHYALVVDTHRYRLDGGTHTLTARSNAGWKITKVEEWLYNQPPVPGQQQPVMLNLKAYDNLRENVTGGPNLSGEALAFTVVDNESTAHSGKWGTVYVTMESVDGKFASQRVALPFPPASKLLMGIGYHDAAYATNVGIATHYHHNSAFQMLSSPYNFGSMEESTYKVEGFRVIGYNAKGLPNGNPNGLHPDRDWHPNSMRDWLNNQRPDVIVLSDYDSDSYGARYTDNEIRLLKEFVDNGGALIMMSNGLVGYASMLGNMLEALLDQPKGTFSAGQGGTALDRDVKNWIAPDTGTYYELDDVDDPILKGVFGDARGKFWGSHYHTGGIRTSLLAGVATPLSDGKSEDPARRGNENYTTIFRHNTKNFVFIGCAGFAASNMPLWQQGAYPQYGPLAIEQQFYAPIARANWGAAGSVVANRVEVYNSVVFANAVAWALTVSNHTYPTGGYVNQP